METHDCSTPEGVKLLIDYAHAVATKYGEGASELSCQMLDAVAEASNKYVPAAEPAATRRMEKSPRQYMALLPLQEIPMPWVQQ